MKPPFDSRFNFELLEPWDEIREHGAEIAAELGRELREDSALFGNAAYAYARRIDCDDVLFRIEGLPEQFAVVHLTWSGKRDQNKGWPSTELFSDLEEWRVRRMIPDHEDYTS